MTKKNIFFYIFSNNRSAQDFKILQHVFFIFVEKKKKIFTATQNRKRLRLQRKNVKQSTKGILKFF